MQAKYKWLLLAPVLAVVLLFGPLRAPSSAGAAAPRTAPAADAGDAGRAAAAPVSPSIGEVASALVGVLLLGVAVVLALSRFTRPRAGGGAELVTLRQSLRLSARHQVHVLQLEDRLLLLGERDGSVTVLSEIADGAARADEAEVEGRADEVDEGAVPRDLVIPRPERPGTPRKRTPPRRRAGATDAADDFRALLKLARAKAGIR